MSTRKLIVLGAILVLLATIISVTLLLIFGSDDTQSLVTESLVALGGLLTSSGLAWLAARIKRDENGDGVPDILEDSDAK